MTSPGQLDTATTAAPDPSEGGTRPPGTAAERRARLLRRLRKRWSFVVLLALIAIFGTLRPDAFLTPFNMRSIATDASSYLIIAVGMTFVITLGGIDLSVGSVLVFSGVVSLRVMLWLGTDTWTTCLVGLAVAVLSGAAWGLVNGLVTTKGEISPLIATLGTFAAAQGLAFVLAGGQDMHGVPLTLADGIGYGKILGIPWPVVIALVVAAIGGFAMSQTKFGRYTCAIGSNEEAARRAAINVDRHLVKVYVLSGLLSGLAGYISLARFQTTTLNGHSTDMLLAILAVVIGGTSLLGGVGTVLGTVIGVTIPSVLSAGFVILGLEAFWQQVAIGVALVVVVIVDQRNRKRASLR